MPRLLKDLQIHEVSSVDRGAGRNVKALLFKRDEDGAVEYWKRDFTQAERDDAASSGAAMPDGSFPIKTTGDLANAISLAGKAKDPAKAKAHIISRARALGATDKLPDGWVTKNNGDTTMTDEEIKALIKKSSDDTTAAVTAATKPLTDQVAKLERENRILKMSDAHKAYMAQCDDTAQKSFADLDEAGRDKHMAANPIKKAADPALQSDVAKLLDTVTKQGATIIDLNKRLETDAVAKRLADFKKQAVELGGTEADGELMMKALSGDAEAGPKWIARQLEINKALRAQVKESALFGEFGTLKGEGGVATALSALNQKAEELRKTETKLTHEQAFAKVYTDPANADLVARNVREDMQKRSYIA